jgi:cytidylate kinase
MIIAIDGPAGAGKGTLAQNLVKRYKFHYLDTGALFRAVSLYLLDDKSVNDDNLEMKAIFYSKNMNFEFTRTFDILLDGKDVTKRIRDVSTSSMASRIATIGEVRENLDFFQKDFANKYAAKGVILDGRDMGTFIAPNAEIKIFLDCPAEVRAKRRVSQLKEMNKKANFDEILANIQERDNTDRNRKVRPMVPADDAISINTAEHSIKDVVEMVSNLVDQKQA